jgi:hypothetical protein
MMSAVSIFTTGWQKLNILFLKVKIYTIVLISFLSLKEGSEPMVESVVSVNW